MNAANDNRHALDRGWGEPYPAWLARRRRAGAAPLPVVLSGGKRRPMDREHADGRISWDLMAAAQRIEHDVEVANGVAERTANPVHVGQSRLIGAEHIANIAQRIEHVEDTCRHLWPAVTSAIFDGARMSDIGKRYGAANDHAPAVGREKLIDGLRFASAAYRDIEAAERADEWRAAG